MTKVWFITGCSRGLGLVITLAALKSGGKVIATCRTPSQLDHLIKQHGPRVFPLALDVADNKAVLAAVRAGHENFGRIDVLVNNAGYAGEDLPLILKLTMQNQQYSQIQQQ